MPSTSYTVCDLVDPLSAVCVQLVVTTQNRQRMLPSDLEELRACKGKRGSPWSPGAGAIPQRAPKLPKRSRQTTVDQGQVPLTSVAGSAKSGVSDISPPSCWTGQGMGGNLAGHGMGERLQDVPQRFASITAAIIIPLDSINSRAFL